MRILMMGTGPFAAPTLEALYDSPHEVVALVTRPDSIGRRGKIAPAGPMRAIAERHGTPVLDPPSVNTDPARAQLADLQTDLMVVCDYGEILSPATLAVTPHGGINLHASLLPKYRGAAPINWAIYHGETETGVTVIHMTPRVDAGPCIAQQRTAIDPDETAVELERRLAEIGAKLVCRTIDQLSAGTVESIPQDPQSATRAPRLTKEHGRIDWRRPAEAIRNQIRAMQPWPRSYTHWQRPGGEPLRLIIDAARVAEPPATSVPTSAEPGTVLVARDDRLMVAAGERALLLESVQPAGKRSMSAGQLLRGYPIQAGHRLA